MGCGLIIVGVMIAMAPFGVAVERHEDQAPGIEGRQSGGDQSDDEGKPSGLAAAVRGRPT